MTIELSILISVISVCAAIIFGFKSAKKADTETLEDKAMKNAEIIFKLDESISMLREMQDSMKELVNRVNKAEKDNELLTMRFAELEKRVEKLEGAR